MSTRARAQAQARRYRHGLMEMVLVCWREAGGAQVQVQGQVQVQVHGQVLGDEHKSTGGRMCE